GAEPEAEAAAVRLASCPGAVLRGFRCGRIEVPYERADPSLGTIGIGFAVRRREDRSRARLGTIFAAEGGPGYSSTGSAREYVATFGGLLERRDLVLVDMRGTGFSRALRCRGSQAGRLKPQKVVANCASELGERFFSYRTSAAADDLDSVRRALGIGRISLYGDSYGTFLAQSYAFRHGEGLRSLVLDSAYPLSGESPWYPSGPRTGMRSLRLACARAPACAGDARSRLRRAVAKLRRNGHSPVPLLNSIWAAGHSPPKAYLAIDSRLRSLLRSSPRPYRTSTAFSAASPGPPPGRGHRGGVKAYSSADEMVVSCNDYPMLWKKQATRAERRKQLKRSIESYPRRRFAPFLPAEVARSIFLAYRYCLTAPPPGPLYEPPQPPGVKAPRAPVLVVSGEMDDVTTPIEGRYAARDFPNARRLVVRNAGHVDALYYPKRRAARAIRAFLARHG
ncbi:MAG: alpha/beta hydrolase, partial [Actinobacteria bacterium]|nr:alpha/beta hydrolase [Actinomycetota bacterium]